MTLVSHLSLLLSLSACQGKDASSSDDTGLLGEDGYLYILEDDGVAPSVDLDQIGEGITGILDSTWTYVAPPLFGVYAEVMTNATSSCPIIYQGTGASAGDYWYEHCSTAGATFDGYVLNYQVTEGNWTGQGIQGTATIATEEGYTYVINGDASYVGSGSTWTSEVTGSFSWDGPSASDSWLGEPVLVELGMYGKEDSFEGRSAQIWGGLFELPGSIEALVFNGTSAIHQSSGCPSEISGSFAVREAATGTWVDIFFDGPVERDDEVDSDACDGCGEAWAEGYQVGLVCVDFAGLVDWGTSAPF